MQFQVGKIAFEFVDTETIPFLRNIGFA
jgi:hypothetical protein